MNGKHRQKPKCRHTATWIVMYQNYQFSLVCSIHIHDELLNLDEILSISRVMEYSTKECECDDI